MKRDDLLAALEAGHEEIEALMEGVSDDDLVAPGVNGEPALPALTASQGTASPGWSVKDVLAHLIAWEAEMVTALAQLKQGRRPAYFNPAQPGEVDQLNEKYYRENQTRPLDRVLADFDGVRMQLIRQVEGFSAAELNAPPAKVGGKTPLLEFILSETVNHERDHLPMLRTWRERLRELGG